MTHSKRSSQESNYKIYDDHAGNLRKVMGYSRYLHNYLVSNNKFDDETVQMVLDTSPFIKLNNKEAESIRLDADETRAFVKKKSKHSFTFDATISNNLCTIDGYVFKTECQDDFVGEVTLTKDGDDFTVALEDFRKQRRIKWLRSKTSLPFFPTLTSASRM